MADDARDPPALASSAASHRANADAPAERILVLPKLGWRRGLAARLALLVGIALGINVGSAWWVLLEQRELHANLLLLTRIYVPFYERLGQAQASDHQLRKLRESMVGTVVDASALPRPAGNDAILRAALQDRTHLVKKSRRAIDEALRDGVGESAYLTQNALLGPLLADLGRLEEMVVEDEASGEIEADGGRTDHESVSRWNRIGVLFRELRARGEDVLAVQERAIEASRQRAERSAWLVSAVAGSVSLLCLIGVILTVRPLRRLATRVRDLAQGQWSEASVLESSPERDNEVSRLSREFSLMAEALHEREQRIIVSEKLAAIGQLAAQITHEIRNPLSALALNVELLGDELESAGPVARKLVTRVDQEVDRLTQITESYLAFARRAPPELLRFDLAAELRSLLDFLSVEHERAGIEVLQAGLDAAAWVFGDPRLLRQAFLNLVRNAQEAVLEARSADPEGGAQRRSQLRVAVSSQAQRLFVDVADSGGGIPLPEDQVHRVFEPFVSSKRQGTGLGLPMVQRIVVDHGGTVTVLSTGPHGTCLRVELPACDPQDTSVSSEPS